MHMHARHCWPQWTGSSPEREGRGGEARGGDDHSPGRRGDVGTLWPQIWKLCFALRRPSAQCPVLLILIRGTARRNATARSLDRLTRCAHHFGGGGEGGGSPPTARRGQQKEEERRSCLRPWSRKFPEDWAWLRQHAQDSSSLPVRGTREGGHSFSGWRFPRRGPWRCTYPSEGPC